MARDMNASADSRLQRNDVLMRMQRRVGLAPAQGLGTLRRAFFWALVCWGPIAAWAALTGRVVTPDGESLLAHFGVTVRLLVAVPLMVIAETVSSRAVLELARAGAANGLFFADPGRLREVAGGLCRLRDRTHPWAVAAGLVLGGLLASYATVAATASHALAWAGDEGLRAFGVRWYLWVARPVFIAFVAAWLWRTVLLGIALHRIARSGVRLVPTHPDRAGGLAFAAPLTLGFGLVAFALSSVVAAGWAHEVTWHGLHVASLRVEMIVTVLLLVAIFIAPFAVLIGPMARAKRRASLQYGALVARHGDALHRRWIEGLPVDDPVLDAPEIGATADAAVLYEAVRRMLPVPLGLRALFTVLLPAALPMVAVLAIEVPIGEMLLNLARALV